MTTVQVIVQHLEELPESAQREVLDFVQFLEARHSAPPETDDDADWSALSLDSAMAGMEDESTPYTAGDLKERFR